MWSSDSHKIAAHDAAISYCTFLEQRILTSSYDKTLKIWVCHTTPSSTSIPLNRKEVMVQSWQSSLDTHIEWLPVQLTKKTEMYCLDHGIKQSFTGIQKRTNRW